MNRRFETAYKTWILYVYHDFGRASFFLNVGVGGYGVKG